MCLCSETHDVITISDSSDEDEINVAAVVMQSCNNNSSSSSSSVCQHAERLTPTTGDLRPFKFFYFISQIYTSLYLRQQGKKKSFLLCLSFFFKFMHTFLVESSDYA